MLVIAIGGGIGFFNRARIFDCLVSTDRIHVGTCMSGVSVSDNFGL